MLRLRVTQPDGETLDHFVEGESLVVGRSSKAGLTIADRFMSREHLRLEHGEAGWQVVDLESRNGVIVNGSRIQAPMAVGAGDVISASSTVIEVLGDASEGTTERELGSSSGSVVLRSAHELLDSQRALPATEGADAAALQRYAERLGVLNEVHQALSQPIAIEDLLELVLDRAFRHLRSDHGMILLRAEDGSFSRAVFRCPSGMEDEGLFSKHLVHEVGEKGMAALVVDVETDQRFAQAQSMLDAGVKSLVAAPFLDPAGARGLIVLCSGRSAPPFTEEDMELLVSLASVAGMRLRNLALAEEAAERRRLESELAMARRIQVTLLPGSLPEVPGYEFFAENVPSRGVSGDYYEVLAREDEDVCIVLIADVCGKGMAASLLTGYIAALTAGPIESGQPPDEVCEGVSRLLFKRTPPEKYATAFMASLEGRTGRVSYANAGHNPALVVRSGGGTEWLRGTGVPIGLLPAEEYGAAETMLDHGDVLVFYTDGITEAGNPQEEEYGAERLASICVGNRTAPLAELAQVINDDLERFVQGVPFADDRTLVVLRRL